MINKYVIYTCYEHYGETGKEKTIWFRAGHFHNTEESAQEELKKMKELSDNTDKLTKLKHFFEIRYEDITTYPIPGYHYKSKGRPSKAEIEKKEEYYKNYWEKYK